MFRIVFIKLKLLKQAIYEPNEMSDLDDFTVLRGF